MDGVLIKKIKQFIFPTDSRSKKITWNTSLLFGIRSGTIVINLLLLKITLNYINNDKYGIWVTLLVLVNWFSFFDIGLGNGLRNHLAKQLAENNYTKAKEYISSCYAFLILIALFVSIIFFLTNFFLDWQAILNAPGSLSYELKILPLMLIAFFASYLVLRLIQSILLADQHPALSSLINLTSNILTLIGVFILYKTSNGEGSLILLGGIRFGSSIFCFFIFSVVLFLGKYRAIAPDFRNINLKVAAPLLSLGGKFFVIQIAAVVLYQTNNIIISNLFGPAQVTPYSVIAQYFSVASIGFSVIITPYWSAVSNAYHKKDFEWLYQSLARIKIIFLFILLGIFILYGLQPYFLKFFLGDKVVFMPLLSMWVAVYIILYMWNSIYSAFLNGIGKIKLQLICAIFGALVNIPLAICLGNKWGICGVVCAQVILFIVGSFLYPAQLNRIFKQKAKGVWNA